MRSEQNVRHRRRSKIDWCSNGVLVNICARISCACVEGEPRTVGHTTLVHRSFRSVGALRHFSTPPYTHRRHRMSHTIKLFWQIEAGNGSHFERLEVIVWEVRGPPRVRGSARRRPVWYSNSKQLLKDACLRGKFSIYLHCRKLRGAGSAEHC